MVIASAGCYALKFAGLAAPQRLLDRPAVRQVVELIPLALLAALIAVQTFATDQRLVLDARAAGLGAALLAVLLRAPFVVVVVVAALAAALTRLI
ncbi:MAG TPA: AzlD domain-containing protein [Mycobacteriales bacterium]|nr:AzlD domain-containing protein [Mycobacteriales bacterium]